MAENAYLVAGGGIAGLAAALGLAKSGACVRLYEQQATFAEVGAGLQMSPNAVRALQWLGAWEAVEPACVVPSEIHVRDGQDGRLLHRQRLGRPFEERFGAPYRLAHRADLLQGLLATARERPAIALNTGTSAIGVAADGARLIFADGSSADGKAIIAADGIRSALRGHMFPDARPRPRGNRIYRALVPFTAVPPEIESDCVTLWLYRRGHVVHYPVSAWRHFNIVAAIDGESDLDHWSVPDTGEILKSHFSPACGGLDAVLVLPKTWMSWAGADLDPLPAWSRGATVLVGDAAHATLPYLAQGAAMALEDACVLSQHLAGNGELSQAFAAFARARLPRTTGLQAEARKLARIYHLGGLAAAARNVAMALAGHDSLARRYGWVYDWCP